MVSTFLSAPRAWHFFYWAVILGLSFWVVDLKKSTCADSIFAKLDSALVQSQQLLRFANKKTLAEIIKVSESYPTEINQRYQSIAEKAFAMTQQLQEKIDSLKNNRQIFEATIPGSLAQLKDSMTIWTGSTGAFHSEIERYLQCPDFQNINNRREVLLLQNSLKAQVEAALSVVFKYHADMTTSIGICCCFGPNVVMSIENLPKVGKTLKADFFIAECACYKNPVELQFFANNQALPENQGLGHFERVFQTVGPHKIDMEVVIKNKATGEVQAVRREFEVEAY